MAKAERPLRSPWLDLPLADYEGHMSVPAIGQAEMLATQFADLLDQWLPATVAVIGCAGGNGFDRLRMEITRRVVAIDINPQYVRELTHRHGAGIPGLETYVCDIQEPVGHISPVDLIYAALIFEYVSPAPVLRNLRSLCRAGGVLATVLQLPADASPVSKSRFPSLKALAAALWLVPPAALVEVAEEVGFTLLSSRVLRLSSGTEFAVQVFQSR